MKNTEHIDVSVVLHEIGDSIMSIEQNSDISRRGNVTLPDFWKGREHLCPLVDSLTRPSRGSRIVRGDVLKNIGEPALSLFSPGYFCHDRMRCAISSFEIVRFASESASPRSTMT